MRLWPHYAISGCIMVKARVAIPCLANASRANKGAKQPYMLKSDVSENTYLETLRKKK